MGIEPVIADVLQPDSLNALPRVDRVFYCVGFDRSAGAAMRAVYVDGLKNVLGSLPDSVDRVVYASSTGVYGQSGGDWVDEDSPTCPQHESGKVCLEAEGLIRERAGRSVTLRFAGLYGPGRIVRRAILEKGEPIPGDPEKFLNMVHIEDAARVSSAALIADEPGPIYVVGDDRPVTRREYYTVAAKALGAPVPRFASPLPGSPEAARDATNKRVSNHRMKRGFDITLLYPDITSGLPEALRLD